MVIPMALRIAIKGGHSDSFPVHTMNHYTHFRNLARDKKQELESQFEREWKRFKIKNHTRIQTLSPEDLFKFLLESETRIFDSCVIELERFEQDLESLFRTDIFKSSKKSRTVHYSYDFFNVRQTIRLAKELNNC